MSYDDCLHQNQCFKKINEIFYLRKLDPPWYWLHLFNRTMVRYICGIYISFTQLTWQNIMVDIGDF